MLCCKNPHSKAGFGQKQQLPTCWVCLLPVGASASLAAHHTCPSWPHWDLETPGSTGSAPLKLHKAHPSSASGVRGACVPRSSAPSTAVELSPLLSFISRSRKSHCPLSAKKRPPTLCCKKPVHSKATALFLVLAAQSMYIDLALAGFAFSS